MVFKNKTTPKISEEQHEQLEYAHRRVMRKKWVYIHLLVYLVGSVFLFIINKGLKFEAEYSWYIWAIVFWGFILSLHLVNVFITHNFMGREWERRQREKLVQLQKQKIAAIQKEIETDFPLSSVNKKKS